MDKIKLVVEVALEREKKYYVLACGIVSYMLPINDAKALPDGKKPQAILDRLKTELPQDYEHFTDMDGVRVDYSDGWFLLKASGTEPKVRVFSEGKTEEMAKMLNRVAMEGLEKAMMG